MSPSFHLANVMEKVITKYHERKKSSNDDQAADVSLVDSNVVRGNPRGPHEESLCERCEELGRPCW